MVSNSNQQTCVEASLYKWWKENKWPSPWIGSSDSDRHEHTGGCCKARWDSPRSNEATPERQVILTWGTDKKIGIKNVLYFSPAVTKHLMRSDWRKAGFLSAHSSSWRKRCGCGSVKPLLRVQLWAERNQRWTLPFSTFSSSSSPPFKFSVEPQPAEWPLMVAFPPHDIFLETPSQTHPGTCLLDDSKSKPGDIADYVTRYLEGFSWFHRSLELNNWSHKDKK